MIIDRKTNVKYRYGNDRFYVEDYYADTIGSNKKVIV